MGTTKYSTRGRPGHKKTDHGNLTASYPAEYKAWHAMIQRCENPKYSNYRTYGARGIRVCEEWKGPSGFRNFMAHVGPRPNNSMSIDRIDNNGNYEPGNVRWADDFTQNNNRSTSHYLTFDGRVQPIRAWAKEMGINEQTLHERLRRGWSVEKTLSTPVRRK